MATDDALHIVVGGGIGGLTAALALLRAGHNAVVFEQAPALGEVGAGLTLSRGAMRCLETLGLGETVRARMAFAAGFPFLHYKTGAMLAGTAPAAADAVLSPPARGQGGHIHRADFHAILVDAVMAYGAERIRLDHALVSIDQDGGSVTAHFANRPSVTGAVLIAADGVRSVARGVVFEEGPPSFSGKIAYRFLLPAAEAMPLLGIGGRSALFVGFGKVFNRYLVSNGTVLNCVGLLRSDNWTREGWHQPATVEELLAEYGDWHPDVVALMRRAPADRLIKWGIFAREPCDTWIRGRIALLGDAAHPMQPFLGLGAAMAVEDGTILGRAFAAHGDIDTALAAYQRARVPRANHVMALSRKQGEMFDETDPRHYPPPGAPAHDPDLSAYEPTEVLL